ncbi:MULTISPECIES: 2-oxoglutarate dehydrogenase complex dihydrolipoyllysine-residue succinyltransferase [Marinobacter]|jgi:2-oxoglutarate dehydrogenase E2 component (dihydrolipoamide succinyltransferase)|uniref:Dihydrolipoyllysine-residue succinyltransferase component of 2-oxoglutarate dehydrogenase complex n=2 Tax=Marinobacter TaxID=2742 RepID=A0ABY1FM99_9GAMM|nr:MULTISPECIES: 2-oxoglutarate dehydrogenase complex dihydrolipoyllysine-residue succinyltransferase [Marinobacter]KXJ45059.1 MAG: dihydrolipoamide succinyltransferase [Marinobacter sp. Hex_13]MBS8231342.1 2-oxoglutarate dehydrogenase complex dihydrolipoyllysine-residue succinyltransferase [Marinobacter salarius]MCZ4285459.1 2-oxoglutarate dehydrogenase complex dihydrolipoyllysine-residue succinyltransferase [Marinobacter salarius]MDC8456935.1 2-oxoglutarate dehydrogenase complex dihydrolipoyl|tara:strand:+ start:903 stop:2153 length:1251 start_codon:yes stop_codon:yes gene_type:complete
MSTEIKAPVFPESVAEGTVATWHKQPGEACSRDELIVDIETDKVVLEVVAPADGVIEEVLKGEGDTVESGEVVGKFKEGAAGDSKPAAKDDSKKEESKPEATSEKSSEAPARSSGEAILSPAARKLAEENSVDPDAVEGTGKDGRVTKEDVQNHIDAGKSSGSSSTPASKPAGDMPQVDVGSGERPEKRVPMTRLRASIAKRLVNAQQTAAMLTTFNEVNMGPVMELRKQYKESFEKRHGVKLGFMSFFTKAATEALKRFPAVNASIDGNDMVYHGYQDIGIAVSSDRGLVVPVVRDTDALGLADIEKKIVEYGTKAKDGKLGIEDMTGGTFTITNGGIFGSLISTPILNPPQTAILGMHKIQERPMAVNGKVEIQPMMYLALSYDHRMIDGKEAVQFLVAIKEMLEDPARILLDV